LWSIEEQPDLKEVTVRISTDESIEGAFASSFVDDYSPQLVIDFDRNENLAEVQLELLKIRQEKLAKKREKKGKKDEKKDKKDESTADMQVNSAGVNKPKKKPGKKRPGNKKPGNNKPAAINLNANKKPGNKKPTTINLNASKNPGNKKPGISNKKPAAIKPNANKNPRPNNNAQGNSRPKPANNNRPKPNQNVNQPNDIGKHGQLSQDSGKILTNTAAAKEALKIISAKSSTIDNKLFLYESPADGWIPSTIYKSDGLLKGLEVMNGKGVNGIYFYLGGESANEYKYGLVNVAAFLAQSMKETIKYDACDEVSLDCSHVFCYSSSLTDFLRT
jgi:hypothetical protein